APGQCPRPRLLALPLRSLSHERRGSGEGPGADKGWDDEPRDGGGETDVLFVTVSCSGRRCQRDGRGSLSGKHGSGRFVGAPVGQVPNLPHGNARCSLLQLGLDGLGHLFRLDLRLEAADDLALAVDEELGEVRRPAQMPGNEARPSLVFLARRFTAMKICFVLLGLAIPAADDPTKPVIAVEWKGLTPGRKKAQYPRSSAEVVNRPGREITLVKPGDGSDCGWRTPVITWTVEGVKPRGVLRCGNVNPLRPNEVFTLKPGQR